MTSPHRVHPFHVHYDRLDRSALVDILEKCGYDSEDFADLTRTELIETLIDSTIEAEYLAEELDERYPLRRPFEPQGLSILREIRRTDGHHVYWCWMDDWEAAVESLIGDLRDVNWGLPDGVRAGDVIVTAVNSIPALVVSVEEVSRVEGGTVFVEPRYRITEPVSVHHVEVPLDNKLPRTTTVLDDQTGDAVLDRIVDLLEHPRPVFVVAGECTPIGLGTPGSSVHALRLLQDGGTACAVCRAEVDNVELHYFRPRQFNIQLEIQDHLDDAAQLCPDCHGLCHAPSLQELRAHVRPKRLTCPECGAENPREYHWGIVRSEFATLESDEYVLVGVEKPDGLAPEYQCRACNTDFCIAVAEEVERTGS